MRRVSNITSYEYGFHHTDGREVPHTNVSFHLHGEYYGMRVSEHLTHTGLLLEEHRFLERRRPR